jgi:uncharacterized protein
VEWTRAGRKFYLSPFEVKIGSHINQDRCNELRCDPGVRQLSVDPAGYIYPCVQFVRAGPESPWCVGHVATGLEMRALRAVREAACQPKEPCSQCRLEPRCLHTCACLNWQTTGTVTQASPVLCRAERLLAPIADRAAETLFRARDPLFIQKHYNKTYPLLSFLEDQLSGA